MSLQMESGSQRVWGYLVTGNYFDLLGIKPVVGRFFRAEDDVTPGEALFAVLSYISWRTRFGDPEIAGRVIRIKNRSYTILGVAPEGFPEIWVPMMMQPPSRTEQAWDIAAGQACPQNRSGESTTRGLKPSGRGTSIPCPDINPSSAVKNACF
jgi:MacB-like periplasmic core domain